MKKKPINNSGELIIYSGKNGGVELRADSKKETIWATQAQIAELFEVNSQAITKHLGNIYSEGELSRRSTCSKMEQVQHEGNRHVRRKVEFYNLDAIIAVGYRVNSKQATRFRIWATRTLREHLIKGFTIDMKKIEGTASGFADLRKTVDFIESRAQGRVQGTVVVKLKKELL
ncbi:MAG: virulence RhuM family protein [Candidatus Pacebacteria bacterium]|nr:virulence RhuM family protein [Candidatus Paceibacterota bacterium]